MATVQKIFFRKIIEINSIDIEESVNGPDESQCVANVQ